MIRSDSIRWGRNAEPVRDDYTRCARCGFPCKLSRDMHAREGSRIGWGIRYERLYLDVTIVGDQIQDIGTTPDTNTEGILTEDGFIIITEDGQRLVIE